MANFMVEAKRVKAGAALTSYETTAMNAINQLKAIKSQLTALKASVTGDSDYTAEDASVVQQVIDDLVGELATL